MKNKPFLIAAIIFGSLSLLFALTAILSFMMGDDSLSKFVNSALSLSPNSFTNSTISQLAIVLSVPAFIFAYRSYSDES